MGGSCQSLDQNADMSTDSEDGAHEVRSGNEDERALNVTLKKYLCAFCSCAETLKKLSLRVIH